MRAVRNPSRVSVISQTRTNAEWLNDLRGPDPVQTQALEELRRYLIRAATTYLQRRWERLAGLEDAELLQLAQDLAQEALLDILKKLVTFRGKSRFTTWAYKFVINVAAEELRRRHWQNISLNASPTEQDLPPLADSLRDENAPDPEKALLRKAVWETLRRIIAEELTERQRTAFNALIIQDAPVEEVARQLETTPNNVYKILHDARKKLKRRLLDEAITPEYVRDIFDGGT